MKTKVVMWKQLEYIYLKEWAYEQPYYKNGA